MNIKMLLAGAGASVLLAGCAGQQSSAPAGSGAPSQSSSADEQVYRGTLPCRSCSGILTTVELSGDQNSASPSERIFTLDAAYQGHPQNPPAEHYQGTWDIISGIPTDPQASVLELTPDQRSDGQMYYFLQIDDRTLELIDPQLHRFENGESLRLQRQ